MRRFSLRILVIILGVLCIRNVLSASDVIKTSGCTMGGELVEIEIFTIPDDQRSTGTKWGIIEWGDQPKIHYLISDIKVLVDGRKIPLPMSAYCNLGNPRQASFACGEGQFNIIILGGLTATPYRAELCFEQLPNKDFVIRYKRVNSRTFPTELWERTEYSFITDDGR